MKPYILNNPQTGVADSSELGFADIRNIDLYSQPGAAQISPELKEWTFNSSANGISKTFTADASTDKITLPTGDNFIHDYIGTVLAQPVTLTTTGTLPAPLTTGTVYYLYPGGTNTTYKLATSITNAEAGSTINITDTGSGTHTVTAVVPGNVKHQVIDPGTGYVYAQDSNARVWVNRGSRWTVVSGNTLTSGSGNGLTIWKNYLFAFRDGNIDVCKLSDYTWTNSWKATQTTSSGTVHKAIAGQDDILYYCDGRYIGAVVETASPPFDPATAGSFTHNTQALDLPQDYVSKDLAEVGKLLVVGAGKNYEAVSKLFPWDRSSPSFTLPQNIPNGPFNCMQVVGNLIFISAGYEGVVYVSNLSAVETAFRVPATLKGTLNTGGITAMCVHQNRLFFSLASDATSGVWSYNVNTKTLALEHMVSYGRYNDALALNPLVMASLLSINPQKLSVAWYDSAASTGAIDTTKIDSNTYYYASYGAYIRGPLVNVGTNFQPRTFEQVSFQLEKQLAAGEGVRIKYRTDSTSSFTTIGTFDYSTYGAIQSFNLQYAIDAENIQVQVELTGSTTTPVLKEVRLE